MLRAIIRFMTESSMYTPEIQAGDDIDRVIDLLDLKPHETILDIGCGSGTHLEELRKRGYTNLIGLDIDGTILTRLHDRHSVVKGHHALLPFSESIDAVLMYASGFMKIREEEEVFRQLASEVHRILRPQGRAYFDLFDARRGNSRDFSEPASIEYHEKFDSYTYWIYDFVNNRCLSLEYHKSVECTGHPGYSYFMPPLDEQIKMIEEQGFYLDIVPDARTGGIEASDRDKEMFVGVKAVKKT